MEKSEDVVHRRHYLILEVKYQIFLDVIVDKAECNGSISAVL
jgi:hypothetical protein